MISGKIPWSQTRQLTEIAQQTDVVTFHADTCRDEDAPAHGFWVEFDALPQAHPVLLFRGLGGTVNDLVHALGVIEAVPVGQVW